jgi:hypothetical protein
MSIVIGRQLYQQLLEMPQLLKYQRPPSCFLEALLMLLLLALLMLQSHL